MIAIGGARRESTRVNAMEIFIYGATEFLDYRGILCK